MTVDPTTETLVPAIPEPRGDNLVAVAVAMKELLEVRDGLRGDPLDQVVTYRELYKAGKLDISTLTGEGMVRLPGGELTFLPLGPRVSDDFNPPPAPIGFTVIGGLANFILQWTDARARYHNHALTEVWRSAADDLGTAVRVGTTEAALYADNVGDTLLERFYWIRHVSQTNVPGPFNATAGTSDTTLQVLTNHIADFAVTNAKIGLLAVDTANIANAAIVDAKIASLNASKITAGDIDAARMQTNLLVAAQAAITQLSAVTANLGTITAGRAQNAGNTNFIDFNAVGATSFLKVGSAIDILANGDATFDGVVISRNLSVASGTQTAGITAVYPITSGDGWILLDDVEFDTGLIAAPWEANDKTYTATAGITFSPLAVFVTYTGGPPTGNVAEWSVKVVDMYTKSRWSGDSTIHLKLELWAQVYDTGGATIDSIEFTTGADWVVYQVT